MGYVKKNQNVLKILFWDAQSITANHTFFLHYSRTYNPDLVVILPHKYMQ